MDEEGKSGCYCQIACPYRHDAEQPGNGARFVDGSVSSMPSKSYSPLRHSNPVNSLHPASKKYGRHFTSEEVAYIFAPSQSTVDAMHEWLVSAGIAADKIS